MKIWEESIFYGYSFLNLNRKIKCKDRNGGIYELKKRRYY